MKIINPKTNKLKDYRLPKMFKNKWIKALKSGKYKQGEDYLLCNYNSKEEYCCLGVACAIVKINKSILYDRELPQDLQNNDSKALPSLLRGLDDISQTINDKLSRLNDKGKSFNYIASYIKRYL